MKMTNLASDRWSKERSLWIISKARIQARINIWLCPFIVILLLAWPLGYDMFQELRFYDGEHFLSNVSQFYLRKWFLCFCTLVTAFAALRQDLVFLIHYRLWKRKWAQSDEVYREANRVYKEIRRMNHMWFPPRELPRISGSAHLDKVEA